MRVDLFVSCCIDQFSSKTGFNLIKLLEKVGITPHYDLEQTCCGQALFNIGNLEGAKSLGAKFIDRVQNADYIVGASSSCIAYMKNEFESLFYNSVYHNKYKSCIDKTYDITDFLVNIINQTYFDSHFPYRVAFVENCITTQNYMAVNDAARQLLKNVNGLTLLEIPNPEVCCGFGGVFAIEYPSISKCLAEQKISHAISIGAEYITSTDMGCLLHLQSVIDKTKLPIQCIHIVDILANE